MHKINRKKSHIGPLRSYEFDRDLAKRLLEEVAGTSTDLGSKLNGKWLTLVRKLNIKKATGNKNAQVNGVQVRAVEVFTVKCLAK